VDRASDNLAAGHTALAVPQQFRRLYRAFVEPRDSGVRELTVFVEAHSSASAVQKISQAVCILEWSSTPPSVSERIYNCHSAAELINEGLSKNIEERLFETGWSGGKATHFASHPLVLVRDPTALLNIWARLPRAEAS
jgi:hypothetical protein